MKENIAELIFFDR